VKPPRADGAAADGAAADGAAVAGPLPARLVSELSPGRPTLRVRFGEAPRGGERPGAVLGFRYARPDTQHRGN
jgi:hypothetical protein